MAKKVSSLTAKQAIALFEKNGGIMVGNEPLAGKRFREGVNDFDLNHIGIPAVYMVGAVRGKSALLVAGMDRLDEEYKVWSYPLTDATAKYLPGLLSLEQAGAEDYRSVLAGIRERLEVAQSPTPKELNIPNVHTLKPDEFGILPGVCNAINQKFAEIKARSEAIGQKLYHHPGG